MNLVLIQVVFLLFGVAFILSFLRVLIGPTLPDRVVALDLLAALAVGVIALYAVVTENPAYVDAAITLALIAFLSTVAFSRYLLKKGRDDE